MARKKPRRPRPAIASTESRLSEVTTVGWMLSVMTTLACTVMALVVWTFVQGRPDNERVLVFVRYLHFSAIVMGVASLCLLGVVLRARTVPPPRSILIFAVVVSLTPILALALW